MRTDRNRLIDLRNGLDLRDRLGPDQTQRMLVRVYDGGAIPTTVPKVYLTNPAVADADDTEGATYSTSYDTAVTIPVVVLGPRIPIAGDLMVAHAIGGRWVASATKATTPVLTCSPCNVPKTSLTLSWINAINGNGSITLTWSSGTSTWTGTIPTIGFTVNPYSVRLQCSTILTFCYIDPGTHVTCCTSNAAIGALHDSTCSPFHLHFVMGSGPPANCTSFYNDGFTDVYIDYP